MNTEPLITEIPYKNPIDIFSFFSKEKHSILLESAGKTKDENTNRFSYIAVSPFEIIESSYKENPFEKLSRKIEQYKINSRNCPAPFCGGAVGFMSYELGNALEKLPAPQEEILEFPDMFFGFYDLITAFDNIEKKAWIISSGLPETDKNRKEKKAKERTEWFLKRTENTFNKSDGINTASTEWNEETKQQNFEKNVSKTVDYIYAGDIFQANITHRYSADIPESLPRFDIFKKLHSLNPAPFASFINLDEGKSVVSASPERFLKLDADGTVETRPIKGTRPRGKTKKEDKALAKELLNSGKDKSENLMIVDLMRNDISRVCEVGTVKTPELFRLESYENVHHLVSVVKGKLRKELNAVDLLKATFPGGSITGAPKIRAMEIINELETARRGVYCGSIMWLGFDGAMDSSIVIRTMMTSKNMIVAHAGGGIVAQSDPTMEYFETIDKISPLLSVFSKQE